MGRDKLRKPKKGKVRSLDRVLAGTSPVSLWHLIVAGGASPVVRHRWVTIGHLANFCLRMASGSRPVRAESLAGLLEACLRDLPKLESIEDYVPNDPRDVVLARLGDDLVRLFPGAVERPVADLERALLVANAVDEILNERRGFGVRDVLDVGLRYADLAIEAISQAWDSDRDDDSGAPRISHEELTAAVRLVELGTPEHLTDTPSHRRALDWCTTRAHDLPYRPGDSESAFGRFLRVEPEWAADGPLWLPLAFLPEAISKAVAELAAEVSAASPDANRRFAQLAAAEVRRALWRFSSEVLGPDDTSDGPRVWPTNHVQWIAPVGEERALVVQVLAGLDLSDMEFRDEPAALTVSRAPLVSDGNVIVEMPGCKIGIPEPMEFTPLLVVATAAHVLTPRMPGLPSMSLDDLRWIASSAESNGDLYSFCRDLARPDLPHMFAWETINIWEWWRANGKSIFRGGRSPSLIVMAAHQGDAEWSRAAERSDLERALLALGLAPSREFDAIDAKPFQPVDLLLWPDGASDGDATTGGARGVHRRAEPKGWAVHLADVPVAIARTDASWVGEAWHLLHDFAGGLAFGLAQINSVWLAAHASTRLSAHVVELVPHEEVRESEYLWVEDVTCNARGVVTAKLGVAWEALALAADADTAALHRRTAEVVGAWLLGAGMGEVSAAAVSTAWELAPPTLVVRLRETPTVRNRLPHPVELDAAQVSVVDRRVAERVHRSGIEPGTYRGDEAKALDRDVLAPSALEVLTEELSRHDRDDVVLFGMRELERGVAWRDEVMGDLERASAELSVAWDPDERRRELENRYLEHRRCNEMLVESALRQRPAGAARADEVTWAELLAAASAYLAATLRSEQVHHQVNPTQITVSDSFEIGTARDAGGLATSYDLDNAAFASARASGSRQSDSEPDGAANASALTVENDLDRAMRESFGSTASDLKTVLFGLAHWRLAPDDPDIVAASREEVVDGLMEITTLGDAPDGLGRVNGALRMLTTSAADLVDADWRPWLTRSRRHRLLVRPIPELSDGRLVVAPHYCLASLGVYMNYLSQGQLPWSQPDPPRNVADALAAIRSARNEALERQVGATLREHGWSTIENVREGKHARLGVPVLTTEVDCVAGITGSSIIWLLEVKDPVEVYGVPEIRRSLDAFFRDGRKPCYVTQLKRKVAELEPYVNEVAAKLGLPAPARDAPYRLSVAFVTRGPVPAAFVPGPFQFITVAELPEILNGDGSAKG